MNNVTWCFVAAFFILLNGLLTAQDAVEVEPLFDSAVESDDQSAVLEYLAGLAEHPLNVNTASVQQLTTLPWISPPVAVAIVAYRQKNGPFRELEEMIKVRGVRPIFDAIVPYLAVSSRRFAVPVRLQGRHRFITKIENAKGYQQDIYQGSKAKVLNRLTGTVTDNVRFGLVSEKDPGEKNLVDYTAGHVLVEIPRFATELVAGNFAAAFGQGLVLWGPNQLSKGGDAIAPGKQRGRGLGPFLSTAENAALFGLGMASRYKKLELSVFASRARLDARLEDITVVSTPETGLHRTASEVETIDRLTETLRGMNVQFNFSRTASLGATLQTTAFDHIFPAESGAEPFAGSGSTNSVTGANFDVVVGRFNSFGEIARSASSGVAGLLGLWCDWSPFELVALWRHYDREFYNRHAFGFGEGDNTSNENGFYFGCRQRFGATVVSFALDQYKSPWPQTFVPMPGAGFDMQISVEQQFSRQVTLSARLRIKEKDQGVAAMDEFGNDIRIIARPQKANLRLQLDCRPFRALACRTRLELSSFDATPHTGLLSDTLGTFLYQDILWRPNAAWRLQARCSMFDAPAYDLRFYQFENDLPGLMRSKMLYGRGKRFYLLVGRRFGKTWQAHLKFENTYLDDRDVIGSGYDAIDSHYENMLSFQLDWSF